MKQSLALREERDLVLMFRLLKRIHVQDIWSRASICYWHMSIASLNKACRSHPEHCVMANTSEAQGSVFAVAHYLYCRQFLRNAHKFIQKWNFSWIASKAQKEIREYQMVGGGRYIPIASIAFKA